MTRPKAPPTPPASADEIELQFYEALRLGDIERLMAVWSDDDDISCVHPGGPRVIERPYHGHRHEWRGGPPREMRWVPPGHRDDRRWHHRDRGDYRY